MFVQAKRFLDNQSVRFVTLVTATVTFIEATNMRILLSFTGFHDPFASSGVVGSEQEGPVLSLIRLRGFDQVYLFSTPNTVVNTSSTVAALRDRYPKLSVTVCPFTFEDPTDYFAILSGLRRLFPGNR